VAVCTAVRNAYTQFFEVVCQRSGITQGLFLQLNKLLCPGKFEGQCHCGNCVNVRTALFTRENSFIDLFTKLAIMGDQHSAARTTERLMCCETDDIGNTDRRRHYLRGNQPGNV